MASVQNKPDHAAPIARPARFLKVAAVDQFMDKDDDHFHVGHPALPFGVPFGALLFMKGSELPLFAPIVVLKAVKVARPFNVTEFGVTIRSAPFHE
ncbi:MAG: hypothetical protein P4N59_32880 [Negativicutes bacterium]|nr:hypothetical protein [Negativicutes bacterium]